MPEEGVPLINHCDILSFEEIINFVKTSVRFGINKLRITGGEPLVRKNIISLISEISKIEGIKDFGLTTNGILLDRYANELKKAGLHRINISLDTVDPEKFKEITRFGNIDDVFKGIEAAKLAGLNPIKINCVVQNSSTEKDALEVAEFCKKNNLQVRFIKLMNLINGTFSIVEHGEGGHCKSCNRLRLTSNGKLKPCLFNDIEYDIRVLGYEESIKLAISSKPECGSYNKTNYFSNIGG